MTLVEYTTQKRNVTNRLCVDCRDWMHHADDADNATVNVRWTLGRHGLRSQLVNVRHTDCATGLSQQLAA